MRAAAKKRRTNEIPVTIGRSRPLLFLVPQEKAAGLVSLLQEFSVDPKSQDWLDPEDVFPEMADPIKGPAAALRGARHKEGLSQIQLAAKLGVTQGDLSKMENGKRPIGKQMAKRLSKVLKINYRVFL